MTRPGSLRRGDPIDPIAIADDLCEVLGHMDRGASPKQLLQRVLDSAGPASGAVLVEIGQRQFAARLLSATEEDGEDPLFEQIVQSSNTDGALRVVAATLLELDEPRQRLESLIEHAAEQRLLPALFMWLIGKGLYERLRKALTERGLTDSPALRRLAEARPGYDKDRLNRSARTRLATDRTRLAAVGGSGFDALIVPGYTPLDAREPLHLSAIPAARRRLDQALADLRAGLAPLVIVSGGSVYPPGTPYNEALMMREYLLGHGASEDQILVEPHARHTTTNLRNTGRMLRDLGLRSAVVVTGFESETFSQAFYLSYPTLSTFRLRCQRELGYSVGELDGMDEHHIAFRPAPEVDTVDYRDPLDP